MIQNDVDKALDNFLKVVAQGLFVEGHEALEDTWKKWKNDPLKQEESYILKGLINGSTALALKNLGRDEPSKRVWATFEKYRPYIYTIDSKYSDTYKKAEALLDEKYIKS